VCSSDLKFLEENWGKNNNAIKFVNKLNEGHDIKQTEFDKIFAKNPKEYQKLKDNIEEFVQHLPEEKKKDVAITLLSGKNKVAATISLLKASLTNPYSCTKGPTRKNPITATQTHKEPPKTPSLQ
jgi:hypothetical protein